MISIIEVICGANIKHNKIKKLKKEKNYDICS